MEDIQTIKPVDGDLELPLATEEGGVLTSRAFCSGKSGSGKSNTVGLICEKILDKGLPLMVIDTEGEYYSLKQEYSVLHIGATEECDLQVGVEHAEKISSLALEQNTPIVLDISGFIDDEKANKLVKQVLNQLFHKEQKLKKPFPVILEEAHKYIPEKGKSIVSDIAIEIGKRGRKRGLGLIAVSQRPASVDKNFITQSDWRIWHHFDYRNDLEVAKDILGSQYSDKIEAFDTGEAILECDFIERDKTQVKFERKKTFDAGATPTLDNEKSPELKSLDEEIIEELQEISEKKRKEKSRIQELEEKLQEKEEEIESLEKDLERAREVQELGQQLTEAIKEGGGDKQVADRLDSIKEEKNERIHELENQLEESEEKNEDLQNRIQELESEVEELEDFREYKDMAEEIEDKKEMGREAIERLAEVFELDMDDSEMAKKQVKQKEKEIEELQETLEKLKKKKGVDKKEERFQDASEFLENEKVAELVEKASNSGSLSEDNYWNVLTVIAQEGKAGSSEILPLVDLSKSGISKITSSLEDHRVLTSEKEGNKKFYKLNEEGVEEIIELQEKRERLKERKKDLKPE